MASERAKLTEAVRAHVPIRGDGRIEYPARANAIKARVPRRPWSDTRRWRMSLLRGSGLTGFAAGGNRAGPPAAHRGK
jgi:hypothetical protein